MKFYFFIFLIISYSCGNKPHPLITKYAASQSGDGLWITLRTGVSGRLARFNQSSFEQTKISHPQISSDTILSPSPLPNELLMLTRMNSDSIQTLTSEEGKITSEIPLPSGEGSKSYPIPYNPQDATRDQQGRIWVVGQNSNSIYVYHKEKLIKEIKLHNKNSDYSVNLDESDSYLEPAIILPINDNEIIVLAQRLRRYYNGSWDWVPSRESALVVINQKTFQIRTIHYLPVSNPIRAFRSTSSPWPLITIIGAGSLNAYPLNGSQIVINSKDYSIEHFQNFSFKVLDAAVTPEGDMALIAWHRDQEYSCVLINGIEVICQSNEEGYVFNKVAINKHQLFISKQDQGSGYLIKIDLDSNERQQISTRGIIESMIIGP